MGLFDFIKRRPDPPPEPDGPSPHYAFAHMALPQIAFADPLPFLGLVASPQAEEFFGAVLADVAEHCGGRVPFAASAIRVHPMRIKDSLCAVLELPAPNETAEAYMVAFAVPSDALPDGNGTSSQRASRYITLEKGFSLDGESRTVLGEWQQGSHLNYGDGPAPSVEEFVAALHEVL